MNDNSVFIDKADRISQIAFELFLENGYEASSIRHICKLASIEPPTLYYFFGSKKELFLSLVNSLFKQYLQSSDNFMASISGLPAHDKLFSVFFNIMRYAIQNIDHTRFFLRFSLFPPGELQAEIAEIIAKIIEQRQMMTQSSIVECVTSGLIQLPPERANATFWRFVTNNTFDLVFSQWQPSDDELQELWGIFFKCRLSGKKL